MVIQILGTGCPKCNQLEAHARQAVAEAGIAAQIVKISDLQEIISFGVMLTPGFAIDGDVKSSGKLLSVDEIKKLLQ